jgi:putative ABC transport system permease protein
VTPLHDFLFGPRAPALWMLALAVLALLALACANVANLTLTHLSLRRAELATRVLVGAARWRVVRMLLVQNGLVALGGGAIGLVAVVLALPPLVGLYNADGRGTVALDLDWRVVGLSLLVIAGTTIACTVIPAVRIHRAATTGEALQVASVRASGGRWERRMRGALVSAQIAVAVTLLCLSATFLRSLTHILAIAPGFGADGVLTMQMMLPPAIYPDAPARATFVRLMLERVEAVPGVVAAGTTQTTFLPAQSMFTMMLVEGGASTEIEQSHIRHITPGYFSAMQVPVLEGRAIDARDGMGAPGVCMVSQAFATRYYPAGNAVGHRVRRAGATAPWMTIVGIAADVRDNGLVNDPGPVLYVPYLQSNTPTARVTLVVRAAGDPAAVARGVRDAIWAVDRHQPIDRVLPLRSVLAEGLGAERFRALLVTAFAAIGLALAIVGVHAVAGTAVVARTWEASLRLALGASPARLVVTMLGDAVWQAGAGAAAGALAFWILGRSISGLVFQTSATDPVVAIGVAVVIGALALAAAAAQMRRLAHVSPAVGLRAPNGR